LLSETRERISSHTLARYWRRDAAQIVLKPSPAARYKPLKTHYDEPDSSHVAGESLWRPGPR
jgi:hypothetical protein